MADLTPDLQVSLSWGSIAESFHSLQSLSVSCFQSSWASQAHAFHQPVCQRLFWLHRWIILRVHTSGAFSLSVWGSGLQCWAVQVAQWTWRWLKHIVGQRVVTLLSVYAPQSGLSDVDKDLFFDQLRAVTARIPWSEFLIPCGDWNGQVGHAGTEYREVHGGMGYGRSEPDVEGERILEYALAFDLLLGNTLITVINLEYIHVDSINWRGVKLLVANDKSADSDQTAPFGAVWSGSTLFVLQCISICKSLVCCVIYMFTSPRNSVTTSASIRVSLGNSNLRPSSNFVHLPWVPQGLWKTWDLWKQNAIIRG